MTGGFSLLASYPRSGNTWARAVLTALARGDGSLDINAIEGQLAVDRFFFDDALEIETSDLLPDEERRLRPITYRSAMPTGAGTFPIKTHDAWLTAQGAAEPPFPREGIEAVVLIVRDPRDVVLSLAPYYGLSIDEAITAMADRTMSLGISRNGLRPQLPQLISSWSDHTASWRGSGLPLTLVRYEDMVADSVGTFATITRALKCSAPVDLLARAVDAARFDRLRADEAGKGFRESSPHAPNRFFGAGTVGRWRQALTAAQASRILRDHGTVMRELGYDG